MYKIIYIANDKKQELEADTFKEILDICDSLLAQRAELLEIKENDKKSINLTCSKTSQDIDWLFEYILNMGWVVAILILLCYTNHIVIFYVLFFIVILISYILYNTPRWSRKWITKRMEK